MAAGHMEGVEHGAEVEAGLSGLPSLASGVGSKVRVSMVTANVDTLFAAPPDEDPMETWANGVLGLVPPRSSEDSGDGLRQWSVVHLQELAPKRSMMSLRMIARALAVAARARGLVPSALFYDDGRGGSSVPSGLGVMVAASPELVEVARHRAWLPFVTVNVHLPHDADNRVALLGEAPSPYAEVRRAAMEDMLAMVSETVGSCADPLVLVAGDTNVRLDGRAALEWALGSEGDVEAKAVSLPAEGLAKFADSASACEVLAQYESEITTSRLRDVAPVQFPATYRLVPRAGGSLASMIGEKKERTFSRKRLPAWPDRVLYAASWRTLVADSYESVDLGCDHAAVGASGTVRSGKAAGTAELDDVVLTTIVPGSKLYPGEEHLRFKVLLEPVGIASWSQFDDESVHIVALREVSAADDVAESDATIGRVVLSEERVAHVLGVVMYHVGEQRLMQMCVASSLQRKGLGRELVSALEAYLTHYAGRGTYITLHARQVAAGFYEKLGYSVHGEPFEEVGVPHFHMHKTL
ncbi:GNAT family Acetyltransferase [Thecamonas trahens ATCC 50062]|uniref:inositol-polyphosphate 5-phosphatase n=1 Tax=Thecamonas trahens ATCC 50062 TaxID=461836 RepID=A0A0L0D1B0_THETB|nr:GNAT family Acetyltransferase [Thecamonas trahens ATCC 50062]KNC46011.1 GNAT family Acetyltransferase [Thecamonas trahens ATCC 50062]|eukprot:XP_013762991.1 GNAT family Acetyltransferase [Thecamonas trahens ATCC 50062]